MPSTPRHAGFCPWWPRRAAYLQFSDYGLPPRALDASARATLAGYHWPGNVRELSNVLERVALLSEAPLIGADLLNLPGDEGAGEGGSATGNDSRRSSDLRESLDELERTRVLAALEQAHWEARALAIATAPCAYSSLTSASVDRPTSRT